MQNNNSEYNSVEEGKKKKRTNSTCVTIPVNIHKEDFRAIHQLNLLYYICSLKVLWF